MVYLGIGIAPDRYAFLLLFLALILGRFKSFVFDFFPFIFLWLSYDFLRGFADNLTPRAHFIELINLERWAFDGIIPTVELQKHFFSLNHLSVLDYLATITYFLHFALALGFAFFLWLYRKSYFREFATAILLLSYAGWITYLIYPAAPPWLAQKEGYLVGVTKILNIALISFPERLNLPTIYTSFNPNEVAAMPSMHAAYPFLILLFLISYFRWRGLLFLPYVLLVWFSIVYLGEHYVIDIIGGVIYALTFFTLAKYVLHNVKLTTALKFIKKPWSSRT